MAVKTFWNFLQLPLPGPYGRGIHGRTKVLCGPAKPDPYTLCGRATPQTALRPFGGWPARRACGLRPSSSPLDTPSRTGLAAALAEILPSPKLRLLTWFTSFGYCKEKFYNYIHTFDKDFWNYLYLYRQFYGRIFIPQPCGPLLSTFFICSCIHSSFNYLFTHLSIHFVIFWREQAPLYENSSVRRSISPIVRPHIASPQESLRKVGVSFLFI
jgi:hypothetical protein